MTGSRNVFVFSREYPPVTIGGTSTVARNLSLGLTSHGWRVVVVTANPDRDQDERAEIAGVTVHRTGTGLVYNRESGLRDASMVSHRRLLRAAMALVEEFGPPTVVALPDLFCFPEAASFARLHQAPILNILLQDFRTLARQDRGRHQVTNGVSAEHQHLLALEEKALRGSDHVAFISRALSDAITGYYPDLPTPHSVEYLGVDEAEIGSVAAADEERAQLVATLPPGVVSRPLLVGCGRLVPIKGFDSLLRAMAQVGQTGLVPHLALIGIGPAQEDLRRLTEVLGLTAQVSFLGDIPRRDALVWMSAATVAVVPSRWESFCYVCAEMMALGRPVVASTADSLNELMPSDSYGYRVPVTGVNGVRVIDPAALAGAIGAALREPAEAARRATAGRARILGQFSNRQFADRMARRCESLAAGVRDG